MPKYFIDTFVFSCVCISLSILHALGSVEIADSSMVDSVGRYLESSVKIFEFVSPFPCFFSIFESARNYVTLQNGDKRIFQYFPWQNVIK